MAVFLINPNGAACINPNGGGKSVECCAPACTCPGTQTTLPPCCCIPIGQPGSCADQTAQGQQCHCCVCGPGQSAGQPRDPCCCIPIGQAGSCQSDLARCRCSTATCCSGGLFRLSIGAAAVMTIIPSSMSGGGDRRCQCVGGVVTSHVSNSCNANGIVGTNNVIGSGGGCNSVSRGVSWFCQMSFDCGGGDVVSFGPSTSSSLTLKAQSGTLEVVDCQHNGLNPLVIPVMACAGSFPGCSFESQAGCLGSCTNSQASCGTHSGGSWSVSNCEPCGPSGATLVRGSSGIVVPDRSLVVPGSGGCAGCGGDGTGGALI